MFGGLPPEVMVLSAVAFAVALGFGVLAPVIPLFAESFGVGAAASGAVISAFALTRLAFALSGGRLVDRFGERSILALGVGIVAVSSAVAGLSQTYAQLVALRGIGGVGSAMFTVSSMSLLLRVVPDDLRGRAAGLYQGGFILGGISGPALAGPFSAWSLRAPFFFYAGTLAVAGGIAVAYLSHVSLRERSGAAPAEATRMRVGDALRNRAYSTALFANFATGWVAFGVRASLIPLFVTEGLDKGLGVASIGFTISAAVQALLLLPAGRLADQRGRRLTLSLGMALSTVSLLLLTFEETVPGFFVAMAFFGAGFGLVSPASGAVVGDIVRGRGGSVVAAYQMAADVGSITGPLLAGWLVDEVSYPAAFGTAAIIVAISALLATTLPETRRSARPSAPAP
nr:MFS transporter [Motilibacter aurantiacus]